MKLLFFLFLLAAFGLLVNIIPMLIKQPLFTNSEIHEVQHRLNNLKYL